MSRAAVAVVNDPNVSNAIARFDCWRGKRLIAFVSVVEYYPGVYGLVHSDGNGRTTMSGGIAGLSRVASIANGLRAAHQYGLKGASHITRDGDDNRRAPRPRVATRIVERAFQDVLRGLRSCGSHPDEEVCARIARSNKAFAVLAAMDRAKATHRARIDATAAARVRHRRELGDLRAINGLAR